MRAHGGTAIVEFPLDFDYSTQNQTQFSQDPDDLAVNQQNFNKSAGTDQVIVHQEFQDKVNNQHLLTKKIFKIKNETRLVDQFNLEIEQKQEPSHMWAVRQTEDKWKDTREAHQSFLNTYQFEYQ